MCRRLVLHGLLNNLITFIMHLARLDPAINRPKEDDYSICREDDYSHSYMYPMRYTLALTIQMFSFRSDLDVLIETQMSSHRQL